MRGATGFWTGARVFHDQQFPRRNSTWRPSLTWPPADRQRTVERATKATPAEKAEAILSELPSHRLNKLAAELEQWLLNEDRSSPKPPVERMAASRVKHWLSDAPYNRHNLRGNRITVDEAVADALKLVAERDAAEPDWFVRRAERLLDAPPTVAKPEPQPIAEGPSRTTPVPAKQTEPSASNPITRAGADLAASAALLLTTDGWLSRLAEHSPDMRTKILAALSDELLRTGFVSGDFCARLYNESRPRALSQFPPRQF
jgi:hypothetical protein